MSHTVEPPLGPTDDLIPPLPSLTTTSQDRGQPHFLGFRTGISDKQMQDAVEAYRAKASEISKSSDKVNLNPYSESKQLAIKLSNLHRLANWIIGMHGLRLLHRVLSLPITIMLAMQTGKYRLDESILTGSKWNDVSGICAHRSEAMFHLNLIDVTD